MRKQLDPRIPTLINNGVKKNHRSFIVLVGDKGRDQVGFRVLYSQFPQLPTHIFALDRESPLPALASPSVCAAFRIMVLQKGTGF